MKCWVQSIQMRRSRALIHSAFSGARRRLWGSPTVARSFISAAAMPFFHVRQSRRLFAAANHFDIASFGCSFSSHRIFLSFCFAVSRHLVVPFFIASLFLFFHYVLHFHRYIFRTHAALRAILAFQIFSVHFVFLHGSHASRYWKSVYASRCPSYFIYQLSSPVTDPSPVTGQSPRPVRRSRLILKKGDE